MTVLSNYWYGVGIYNYVDGNTVNIRYTLNTIVGTSHCMVMLNQNSW